MRNQHRLAEGENRGAATSAQHEALRRDAAFDIADRSVDLTDRDESHHLIVMDDGEEIGPWRAGESREQADAPE